MPHMTPYQKGYIREIKAREVMQSWFGCVTVRSAGSHSIVDIIAGNGIDVFAVQVKSESDEGSVDWNKLRYYAQQFQAIPTLLVYCKGGRWKVYLDEERFTKEDNVLGTE